jgi:hypothetical protein
MLIWLVGFLFIAHLSAVNSGDFPPTPQVSAAQPGNTEKPDMNRTVRRVLPIVIASLLIVNSAFATDGYFLTGYGTKQQGQGGAGVAKPGDSLAGATNPAGLTLVGNRLDIGLALFRPNRSTTIIGNQLPPGYPNVNGTYDANRVKNFELPELGYSLQFHLCLAKIPSVCKSGSILELGGSLGTGFRLKEGALRDLGSSRRQHKVGSARSAGTALPQFFFDSEAKSSRQRLRRPDRNDDADRRALASL